MTSQIAFWVTGGILMLLIARRGAATRDWEMGVGMAAPALFLLLCLWGGEGFGDFRLRLEGLAVDRQALVNPLSIGGSGAMDDIVFEGLPPAAGQLQRDSGGAPRWLVGVGGGVGPGEAAGDDALSLVEVRLRGGQRWIAGSEPLLPGDLVCLARCGRADALTLRLRADGRAMEDPAGRAELPEFRSHPYAWAGIFWGPHQVIYPLRDYGLRWRGVDEAALQPCGRRFLCRTADAEPIRSFVYRTCGGDSCLRIVLLDPGARLLRDGGEIHRAHRARMPLEGAQIEQLVFSTVAYGSPYDDPFGGSRPASRLRMRGVVEPVAAGPAIELGIVRAGVVPITRKAIDEAADGAPGEVTLTLVGAQAGVEDSVASPLPIAEIGGVTGRALGQRLRFQEGDGYGRKASAFSFSGQAEPILLGRTFRAGDSEPQRAARLRLERLDRPVALLLMMPILWAWILWFVQQRSWRANRVSFLLAATMQWLLALRVLIAAESAAFDPGLSFDEGIGGNIAAYVALPLALAAASPAAPGLRTALWPAVLFAAFVWLTCVWAYGWNTGQAVTALAIAFAAAATAREHWGRAAAGLVGRLTRGRLSSLRHRTGAAVTAATDRTRAHFARTCWAWPAFIAAIALLRLMLVPFGIRERFTWPAPFAVSIVYVPLILIGFAGLFSFVLRSKDHEWRELAAYVGSLVLALVITPFIVGDYGLFIYVIPLVALAFAVSLHRKAGRLSGLAWNALPIAAGLLLVVGVAYGKLQGSGWEAEVAAAAEEARAARSYTTAEAANARAAALLAEATGDDRNVLRLWTALAPERVARSGTSDAESQRRVSAILSEYTSSLPGRGYMTPSDPADIRPYQADDNVSAVHVMSPFGRIGAALLVMMLGLLAWRASPFLARGNLAAVAGLLATWTLFATAFYMVLGNLQLVPFTGRNIYLLAALSASDLVEGWLLFTIAALGLREGELK